MVVLGCVMVVNGYILVKTTVPAPLCELRMVGVGVDSGIDICVRDTSVVCGISGVAGVEEEMRVDGTSALDNGVVLVAQLSLGSLRGRSWYI